MSYLQSYIEIAPGLVSLNGEKFFQLPKKSFDMELFFSILYSQWSIDYRKFYKMDALSKLGFLASELLLKGSDREKPKRDMGIIFFNRSASLEADKCYQRSIQDKDDFFPSPAEFVYTIPNIVTGELAIRNKIFGETAFYVMQDFYEEEMSEIINDTIKHAGLKCALAGWVEVDAFKNLVHCFMMLCSAKMSNKNNSHLSAGLQHVKADKNILFDVFAINKLKIVK